MPRSDEGMTIGDCPSCVAEMGRRTEQEDFAIKLFLTAALLGRPPRDVFYGYICVFHALDHPKDEDVQALIEQADAMQARRETADLN